MKNILILLFCLLYVLPVSNAQVSKSNNLVTIITDNDQSFVGELLTITTDSIFIMNVELGKLSFSKSKIKSLHDGLISPYFNGTTNSSVPFYVQSALPNGKGNHYYKNYYIFGNEFNFGISENLNLTFGFETASLIFDSGNRLPVIQLGAKYSIPMSDKIHAGLSAKYYFNDEGNALMIGVPITFGSKRTNFTVAPNYLSSDDSKSYGIYANLSLALDTKIRFIIDFIHIDDVSISTILLEILFRSGVSLSGGALVTSDGTGPNLSFSIPFGKWKNKSKK